MQYSVIRKQIDGNIQDTNIKIKATDALLYVALVT